jgi:hypothetical protein
MPEDRRVRLIRKTQPEAKNESSTEAKPLTRPQPSEREIKTVVSRWVSEHRQKSEEFRLTFAALLQGEVHLSSR